jgi:hypothetical protein
MNEPTLEWWLPIVCTDRRRHKRTRLATVKGYRESDGSISKTMGRRDSWTPPLGDDAEPGEPFSPRSSYGFYCRRCHRNPQFRREDWWELVRHVITETRLTELDLSRLPLEDVP